MSPKAQNAIAATVLILAVVGSGAFFYWLVSVGEDPNTSYARGTVCAQKAHELGFRFLDYVHPFGECWAQRPDGSIVDLFAEAEP